MHSVTELSPHKQAVRDLFDRLAPRLDRWRRHSRHYYREIARLCRFVVPPGASVLEMGCGTGDLLASLEPADGLGIDLSPAMVESARAKHPHLRFEVGDAERPQVGDRRFDYIVLSDLLGDLEDVQSMLRRLRALCDDRTRIVITYYNHLWEPLLKLATAIGQRIPRGEQNWLPLADVENLLTLADFEVVRRGRAVLAPKYVPVVSTILNRFVAKLPVARRLGLVEYLVARARFPARADAGGELSCSVVIPCRNERGNVAAAIERVPPMGRHTEILFVDGASTDGTREEIRAQMGAWKGRKDIKLVLQDQPHGKGEATRMGFSAASGDVLMILDADLTVAPEDLPKFFDTIAEGRGEFVNGTRLVYPMAGQAMRTANLIGNKLFSLVFTWLLDQRITDTLCGTKVVRKRDYEKMAASRAYFGDFDPFGDFDLLFGAAKSHLKIVEVPIRYRERTYGTTKIRRWRHGWLLLRMSLVGLRKLKLG